VREVLTGLGAACEFVGILLVASPELFPRLSRAARSFRGAISRRWAFLLARLGRGRNMTIDAGPGVIRVRAGGASVEHSIDASTPLERQLAFFRDEITRAQKRLNTLEAKVAEHPEAWRQDIDAARGELETFVMEQVERERDVHITVRLWGIVFLLVGVPLLAVANVV
jgi:hypothetical protein